MHRFPQPGALGLYISVPFCRAKCSFCNFASGVAGANEIETYVARLCVEIAAVERTAARAGGALPRRVETVYFGGGTPSLLSPPQLNRIFTALRGEFAIAANAEITLEAAPGQIADDLLEAALRCGVGRISLGVQSFVDAESRAVGRSHTAASCTEEIARLRHRGVSEVAADLIAGLPLQTAASWTESLDRAMQTEATHWSVYMFECDDDSRLGRELLAGGARLFAPTVPGADEVAAMYEQACACMEQCGFPLYEISNFAAPAHQSRHNRKYWERAPYLGFGVDAHSMLRASPDVGHQNGARSAGTTDVRFANPDTLDAYRGCRHGNDAQAIGRRAALEETLFLGLRLCEGVRIDTLPAALPSAASVLDRLRSVVRDLVEAGLMCDDGQRWRLSARGRMVSNEVFERLIDLPQYELQAA